MIMDKIVKHDLPADTSGITVEFHRYYGESALGGTAVVFKIPDHCQILSRDPMKFMEWCYDQMIVIATQAQRMGK